MVKASFSSNQCEFFSQWPVGIAHTGTKNGKCLQVQFSVFDVAGFARYACPISCAPLLVFAAPVQSPHCHVLWPRLCLLLSQPRAWEAVLSHCTLAAMTVSAMGLFLVTSLDIFLPLLELC